MKIVGRSSYGSRAPFRRAYERSIMKIVILYMAKVLGFFALSRWLTRRGLRILCYHGVWLGRDHYGNFLFMSPQKFAARMEFLARADYPMTKSLSGGFYTLCRQRKFGMLPHGDTISNCTRTAIVFRSGIAMP